MTQRGAGACVSIASARSSKKTKPVLSKHQYDIIYERHFKKLQMEVDGFVVGVQHFLRQLPSMDSINRIDAAFAEIIILFAEVENTEQILMNTPRLFNQYYVEPRNEIVKELLEKARDEYTVATNSFTGRKNMLKSKATREHNDLMKRHTALKASMAASAKEREDDLMRRFEALKTTKSKRGGNIRKKRVHT